MELLCVSNCHYFFHICRNGQPPYSQPEHKITKILCSKGSGRCFCQVDILEVGHFSYCSFFRRIIWGFFVISVSSGVCPTTARSTKRTPWLPSLKTSREWPESPAKEFGKMFHNNPAGVVLLKGKDQYGQPPWSSHQRFSRLKKIFTQKTSYFDEGDSRTEPSP